MVSFAPLQRSDHAVIIETIEKEMHLEKYIANPLIRRLHARSFFYEELAQATHVFAAYDDGEFAGLVLLRLDGHKPQGMPLWARALSAVVHQLEKKEDGIAAYARTNAQLLEQYQRQHGTDGEILLLSANPRHRVRGIGSALLSQVATVAQGKHLYLFTDEGCTFEFYNRKGFHRVGEQTMEFNYAGKPHSFRCFLYSTTIGAGE
ncbi:GNAT family N-acetyltransferase [Corynebacterium aquilae]|uniref:N-acetyltransferase domain-containing protein n=1 Tax=Corynebacterium aquilae DSM 44791 TaxID=1431546 RepID=A0A1L7CG30_9CORY|nr:GNAT family N-acetyltransferase [Corynebacterium aquilae]APT84733.1 hypothetical protein CAQU_06240 [Corynebacterium aquilae DSM 44791]